jgi:hypothetical protein
MAELAHPRAGQSTKWSAADRVANALDPLPGIVAVRYEDALAAAERAFAQGDAEQSLRHLANAAELMVRCSSTTRTS